MTSATASAETGALIGVPLAWVCKILDHGSNAGSPGSNEFGGISCDYNQIFQGSNRRDEKVWLSKGVLTLLSFDHHGFPADNNTHRRRSVRPKRRPPVLPGGPKSANIHVSSGVIWG